MGIINQQTSLKMVSFHSFLYVKTRPGMSCWIQQRLRDPWHGDARHQVINLHLYWEMAGWAETKISPSKMGENHGKTMENRENHGTSASHSIPDFFSGAPPSSILHTIEPSARRCAPALRVEEVDQVAPLRWERHWLEEHFNLSRCGV